MAVIKIPRQYLVGQDEDSITIDVPDNFLLTWPNNQGSPADQAREKLALLSLTEVDVADAVAWVRQEV